MDESSVRRRLAELYKIIASSSLQGFKSAPSHGSCMPASPARDSSISESFDYLLLQLKYLLFDLEATRRENRYLREMLESRSRRDREDTEETA